MTTDMICLYYSEIVIYLQQNSHILTVKLYKSIQFATSFTSKEMLWLQFYFVNLYHTTLCNFLKS